MPVILQPARWMVDRSCCWIAAAVFALTARAACAQGDAALREALTFHASFEDSLDAVFSSGGKACTVQQGGEAVPAAPNSDVRIAPDAGRFGHALQFVRKSRYWPQYQGDKVLNYNGEGWSSSVSVWLRLNPDKDLEPGYCDPVQVVGDSVDKGFIFLEWSKDHTPRRFRYAIRPLKQIWNPTNVGWEDIAINKRPVIELDKPIFSADGWTHVVFTLENINSASNKPLGKLYVNGKLEGTIENWDLRFGWDPSKVRLVLGASYVGYMDDVAVFSRALTGAEVKQVFELPNGISALHP